MNNQDMEAQKHVFETFQSLSALLDPNLRLSPDPKRRRGSAAKTGPPADGQAAGNGTASAAARDGSTNAPQDRHIYALLQQRAYRGPAMSSARDASMEADPGTATGSQDAKLWTSSKEKLKQEISAIKIGKKRGHDRNLIHTTSENTHFWLSYYVTCIFVLRNVRIEGLNVAFR